MSRPFTIDPQTLHPANALELIRETISEVIDISTDEESAERPAYGMDVLQKLRSLEDFVEEIVDAQRAADPEASE